MNKEKMLNKLEMLREFVKQSESDMKLAKISYRKYQEDLKQISQTLDEMEEEIKMVKGKTIFDKWFGNPLESIENNFNDEVHKAIEDIYERSEDNL